MAEQYTPRRGKAHQVFTTTDAEGREITVRADKDGLVHPHDDRQQALVDAFDLPHARTANPKDDEGGAAKSTAGPQGTPVAPTQPAPATTKGGTTEEANE